MDNRNEQSGKKNGNKENIAPFAGHHVTPTKGGYTNGQDQTPPLQMVVTPSQSPPLAMDDANIEQAPPLAIAVSPEELSDGSRSPLLPLISSENRDAAVELPATSPLLSLIKSPNESPPRPLVEEVPQLQLAQNSTPPLEMRVKPEWDSSQKTPRTKLDYRTPNFNRNGIAPQTEPPRGGRQMVVDRRINELESQLDNANSELVMVTWEKHEAEFELGKALEAGAAAVQHDEEVQQENNQWVQYSSQLEHQQKETANIHKAQVVQLNERHEQLLNEQSEENHRLAQEALEAANQRAQKEKKESEDKLNLEHQRKIKQIQYAHKLQLADVERLKTAVEKKLSDAEEKLKQQDVLSQQLATAKSNNELLRASEAEAQQKFSQAQATVVKLADELKVHKEKEKELKEKDEKAYQVILTYGHAEELILAKKQFIIAWEHLRTEAKHDEIKSVTEKLHPLAMVSNELSHVNYYTQIMVGFIKSVNDQGITHDDGGSRLNSLSQGFYFDSQGVKAKEKLPDAIIPRQTILMALTFLSFAALVAVAGYVYGPVLLGQIMMTDVAYDFASTFALGASAGAALVSGISLFAGRKKVQVRLGEEEFSSALKQR